MEDMENQQEIFRRQGNFQRRTGYSTNSYRHLRPRFQQRPRGNSNFQGYRRFTRSTSQRRRLDDRSGGRFRVNPRTRSPRQDYRRDYGGQRNERVFYNRNFQRYPREYGDYDNYYDREGEPQVLDWKTRGIEGIPDQSKNGEARPTIYQN